MNDDNKIILYGSIQAFEDKVSAFEIYNKQFEEDKLDESMFFDFLTAIEGVVNFYYRYIKRYYKIIKSESIIKPIDAYNRAKSDGFINDADCWIEYISDLNALLNLDESNPIKKETTRKFLDYYRRKIPLTFEHIRSEENKKILEDCKPLIAEFNKTPIILPDEKPVYSCEYLGISQESYKIIMDFFKSKPSIKSVWMHGSRAHGDAESGSDIDMFIDCPLEDTEKIKEDIEALPIPYLCDISNIYDTDKDLFIKRAARRGTKKIYSADDFKTYWGESEYKTSIAPIDISKLVAEPKVEKPQFMLWQDFYHKTWKPSYKLYINNLDNRYSEEGFKHYFDLYENTYTLMRTYLSNNGLFLNGMWMVIKYAYRVFLIDDGDDWMKMVDKMYRYSGDLRNKTEIYESCAIKRSFLFTDLNNKLNKLAEENEKITD